MMKGLKKHIFSVITLNLIIEYNEYDYDLLMNLQGVPKKVYSQTPCFADFGRKNLGLKNRETGGTAKQGGSPISIYDTNTLV